MAYALLEPAQVRWAERVRFGHDWDEVHACAQTSHDLNIQRLERMSGRTNEVQTSMHPQINLLRPAWLLLLQHIALMLIIQKLDDRLPAIPVIHIVAEPRGVDNRKADFEELLLQLGLGDFDLDRLVDLLGVAAAVVGVVLDGGGEEGVDEGRLAQSGFAGDHDGEGGAALGHDFVALVGELRECGQSGVCLVVHDGGHGIGGRDIHWQCQSGSLIPPWELYISDLGVELEALWWEKEEQRAQKVLRKRRARVEDLLASVCQFRSSVKLVQPLQLAAYVSCKAPQE